MVKLIRLGVASLSGDYRTLADISTTTGQVSDILTPRMQAVESEVSILKKQISRLEDKLNGLIVSDNLAVVADTVPDALPPIVSDTLPDIVSDILPDTLPDTISSTLPDTLADTRPDTLADTLPAPGDTPTDPTLKSITEDVLKFLAAKKASKEMKNQDVADWLLTNGYGRYDSTTVSKKLKPYLP